MKRLPPASYYGILGSFHEAYITWQNEAHLRARLDRDITMSILSLPSGLSGELCQELEAHHIGRRVGET